MPFDRWGRVMPAGRHRACRSAHACHMYGHRRAANGNFATGTIRQAHRSGHADDTPR
jgi:hypothetical protein